MIDSEAINTYSEAEDPQEELVQVWKIRRQLKMLEEMSGSGTSMITMYIPPKKDALNKANKKLADELSSSANIKSNVNKNQVQTAITAISEKIKLYKEVPKNGLVIFCGTAD